MRVTFRTMLFSIIASSFLTACAGDMMSPDALESSLSASVSRTRRSSLGAVSIRRIDSLIVVGDSTTVVASARNVRTMREVTREMRFVYSSSDTSVASVSRSGVVVAHAPGAVIIRVRALLGSAAIPFSVVKDTTATLDSSAVSNLPARADEPPVAVAPIPVEPVPAEPVGGPIVAGGLPPFAKPMLPAASVDVRPTPTTGRSLRVPSGDSNALQMALRNAVGGDEIVLPAGSEFVGSFSLPKHAGDAFVTLRSEGLVTPLGTRITPAAGAQLARIVTTDVFAAIKTEPGASKWRLQGLNVSLRAGAVDNYGIVTIGSGNEATLADLPSDIILDRVIVNGGETGNTSRCVSMNGNSLAVVDSWLAECHAKGRDAQGICSWTGMGPFLIQNNHIEGSGQNVMFGGADPQIYDLTMSDITIRGNHFFKPMSWANGRWTVKASFELKHARRVLFEGNVLENHWIDAQVGYAILFQIASANALWTRISDVTVQNNLIENSTSGINILSRMLIGGRVSNEPSKRILVRNNLFKNVGKDPVNGLLGRMVQLLGDHEDVTLAQNTFFGFHANNAVMLDGAASKRTMLFNNVFDGSEYGLMGSGFGEGVSSLKPYLPGAIVEGNVLVGRPERLYPVGNSFPASLNATDFVSSGSGDFTLRATTAFSSHAGSLVGVDGRAIQSAIAQAITR